MRYVEFTPRQAQVYCPLVIHLVSAGVHLGEVPILLRWPFLLASQAFGERFPHKGRRVQQHRHTGRGRRG